jgi:hypothetical protein
MYVWCVWRRRSAGAAGESVPCGEGEVGMEIVWGHVRKGENSWRGGIGRWREWRRMRDEVEEWSVGERWEEEDGREERFEVCVKEGENGWEEE